MTCAIDRLAAEVERLKTELVAAHQGKTRAENDELTALADLDEARAEVARMREALEEVVAHGHQEGCIALQPYRGCTCAVAYVECALLAVCDAAKGKGEP